MVVSGTPARKWRNWAEIASCSPERFERPKSIEELKSIVQEAVRCKKVLKVVGAGHSPSDIACTDDWLVSLDGLNRVLFLDVQTQQIQVEGGTRLRDINAVLDRAGLALPCLPSISDQSIAGAISTGTHGSGAKYGAMHCDVVRLQLLTAGGEVLSLSRTESPDVFSAALLGLGALGIIVTVTLQCEPAFRLRQVQRPLPLAQLEAHLEKHLDKTDHLKYCWFPHTDTVLAFEIDRTREPSTPPATLFAQWLEWIVNFQVFQLLLFILHLLPMLKPLASRFWQWFRFGDCVERVDVSHKVFNFDCLFRQYVAEWAVPVERTMPALRALFKCIDDNGFKVDPFVEIRFTRGDDVLLSPSRGATTCWIGVIMYKPYGIVPVWEAYFDQVERVMRSFGARPHWAKAFKRLDFTDEIPGWRQFLDIRRRLDPTGIFVNAYVARCVAASAS